MNSTVNYNNVPSLISDDNASGDQVVSFTFFWTAESLHFKCASKPVPAPPLVMWNSLLEYQ